MIKQCLIVLVLMGASCFKFDYAGDLSVSGISDGGVALQVQQENKRMIEFVNDIPDLVEGLPEETEELQAAIFYGVELNGVLIKPGQVKMLPVYDDHFVIVVQSKRRLADHVDSISESAKKAVKMIPSFIATYYSFTCDIQSDIDIIHLAMPVLYGCDALKKSRPYKISYKWPRGVKICLKEIISLPFGLN